MIEELSAFIAETEPLNRRCCFGFNNGPRCTRTAYYRTYHNGEPLALIWCSTHKPAKPDAVTTLRHFVPPAE